MTGLKVTNHTKFRRGRCENSENARNVVDNFKASVMPEKWHPCNYDINSTDPLG